MPCLYGVVLFATDQSSECRGRSDDCQRPPAGETPNIKGDANPDNRCRLHIGGIRVFQWPERKRESLKQPVKRGLPQILIKNGPTSSNDVGRRIQAIQGLIIVIQLSMSISYGIAESKPIRRHAKIKFISDFNIHICTFFI